MSQGVSQVLSPKGGGTCGKPTRLGAMPESVKLPREAWELAEPEASWEVM